MAVRESWYLAITWRKSSFSGNDADCVQVADCESPSARPEDPVAPDKAP